MKVGVPTEIKTDEYRVAITPSGVRELAEHGHEVLDPGGRRRGHRDHRRRLRRAGRARSCPTPTPCSPQAEMVLKVKEPQPVEVALLRAGPDALHLPAPRARPRADRRASCDSGATCIAYETVEDAKGRLPLLAPMSEIAGKIATQAGAFMLEKPLGGRGILLGGVPGVAAGQRDGDRRRRRRQNAALIAIGMEADGLRLRPHRSTACASSTSPVRTAAPRPCYASTLAIEQRLPDVDLVIGAVLVKGGKAPHVITREQLKLMKRGAVLVDVSIDQGGCFETSHADHPHRPDLRGRRDHPLLRREHARRGADHVHLRAHQRDDALRARARRPRRRRRRSRATRAS